MQWSLCSRVSLRLPDGIPRHNRSGGLACVGPTCMCVDLRFATFEGSHVKTEQVGIDEPSASREDGCYRVWGLTWTRSHRHAVASRLPLGHKDRKAGVVAAAARRTPVYSPPSLCSRML